MATDPVTAPEPRRKKSRVWLYVLAGVVLVAAVGGGVAWVLRSRNKGTVVTTEKAVIKTIVQRVSATGKIQPEVEVKISPEVAGEIVELPFREGDTVRKGDLLVRIKPDFYRFQVEQQEAEVAATRANSSDSRVRLVKAEEDYRRAQGLAEKHLISAAELTAAKTTFEAAQANYENSLAQIRRAEGILRQAQDQLEKTTIYSPMDGTVSSRTTEVGERVVATGQFTGTEVMRIADLRNMEVRVNVNENDVVNVKIGDKARVTVDAYPNRHFTGEVAEIASTARTSGQNTQEEVTNFQVKIRIVDQDAELRPGMSANAEIETATVAQVVAVPIQSVTVRSREGNKTLEQMAADREKQERENKGEGAAAAVSEKERREQERAEREGLQRVVFIVSGGAVKMAPVKTGIMDLTHMEIQSGVAAGDEVVSGSFNVITRVLNDGMKVRVEAPPKTPAAAK